MKIILTTLAAAGIALSTGAALAQSEGFASADGNADGFVSLGELLEIYPDYSQDDFDTADSDGDGVLSEDEFSSVVIATGGIDSEVDAGVSAFPQSLESLTYTAP